MGDGSSVIMINIWIIHIDIDSLRIDNFLQDNAKWTVLCKMHSILQKQILNIY